MEIKQLIRNIPDFPEPGIIFRDITTLLRDQRGLHYTIDTLTQKCQEASLKPQYIIGIESRGFIFGPALAYQLQAGFIPVRKPGKLPAAVHSVEYALEYGTDTLEMHQDALDPDAEVLIVDDLIATGGTAAATANLVQRLGGKVIGFAFVIELDSLNGRQRLPQYLPIISLVSY